MRKVFILALTTCSFFALNSQNFNQLDKFFETLYENDKIMGSIAISKDGKSIYSKSVGYQYLNGNKKHLASSKSKYRIGSVTKTFTAVMIFQLIDEGKLKMETTLNTFYPDIPNSSKIRIKHLLNHSSGLYNITNEESFREWMYQPSTNETMLERITAYDVVFQPEERHEYSNTNFLILGYILEMIEGKPYKEILKERITQPLSLTDTYVGSSIDINKNECISYAYEQELKLIEDKQTHMSNPGGAGAIVSNPEDLVVFMDALFNNKLMTSESFKSMTTISGDEYGSGILSTKKDGLTIFAHNGSIDMFQSMLLYIPEKKLAIAFNANALNYSMMPIMFNAIAAALGNDVTIPSFKTVELTEVIAKQFAGVYGCEGLPFNLIFESDGNVLKGAPEGNNLKVLKATSDNEFTLDTMGIVLKFNLNDQSLMFKQAGQTPKKCYKQN